MFCFLRRIKNQKGMSLIEIMIVLGIIAAATTAIMSTVFKNQDLANIDQAKAEITKMAGFVKLYKQKSGKYPTTDEGLQALVDAGYMEEVPMDPWKNPYNYASPGSGGQKFEICSDGPESDDGGDSSGNQICNWSKDSGGTDE